MRARDPNTMDSFQDGGQQHTKSERNDYPPMERSHVNAEVNNFSNSSGEGTGGPENLSKLSDGIQPSTVQNYAGYNRSNYGMGDQHGGAMSSTVDYNNQNSQFSGQFSQMSMRSPYPGMPKPTMSPGRPGMMPSGMGMPGSYGSQRMIPSSQSGPTPTLNQLLQTPNPGQRFQGNYGDFTSGQGKGGEMGGGPTYPVAQQGWNGNPRAMGPYPPSSMPGTYRSQGSSLGERSRGSGMSPGPGPGYPHQGQYIGSAMAANTPRYMMGQMPSQHPMSFSPSMPNQTSQLPSQQQQQQQQQMYHGQQQQPQPPGQPPPQPSPTHNQQPHHSLPPSSSSSSAHRPPSSQGASPRQLSPAPPGMADQNSNHSTSSRKSEENTESNRENTNSYSEEVKGESENTLSSQSHLSVATGRPVPSPAGSTGSRSDTPASNSGAQAGSPMPPRPPSSHLEGQGHTSQPPMATQGYSQQMMPPPMGGQMGYPGTAAGGKMGAGPPGMTSSQMAAHYAQYSSQYPQGGTMRGQGVMGSMQGGPGPAGSTGPMPGSASYPQAMYNGPGQMGPGPSSMYNSAMMSRGMPAYSSPYGPGSGMPINSHFGSFNSHMGPGPGPGPGPGSGPNPAVASSSGGPNPMMPGQMNANSMGQPGMGMQQHGAPMMPGGKGAQAAAQAALMAAANSAGMRMPSRGMAGSPRMMGPQGGGSPSPMTVNLGNPSLNSMSNQIQQITSSSVTSPANTTGSSTGHPSFADKNVSSNSMGLPPGHGGAETAHLMSPMSGSDTQESSRPSSTTTPGQTVDAANNTTEVGVSDGSGSMPSSDSTSVDSGFHSTADQSEKAPSESTPTHSSSPSNSNPLPSTNGPCGEEGASQESDCVKGMSSVTSAVPTTVHPSTTTTTTITSASVGSSKAPPSLTSTASSSSGSEMLSSSSQTSTSMPMMMSSSTNCNNPPATSIPNGPHYPHPHHPHPAMGGGYSMGGPGGAMGGSHMMGGPGMPPHHPGMQHSMGGAPMAPYNMGPNSMPSSSMGPGGMGPGTMGPNGMPPNSMPSNMPPNNMPSNMPPNNMPPGSGMSGGMPPQGGGMPGNMPPQGGGMPGNMPPQGGGMPGNMPPQGGGIPGNMPQGGGMPGNMPPQGGGMPGNMPPQGSGMPPHSMPGNLLPHSMPGNLPPGTMMNNMQSHGAMPGAMPPGVGMAPQQAAMPNSMSRGSMANHMPPGSMVSSMPPGNNNLGGANGKGHSMGPMNMPAENNTAARASGPDNPPEKKKKKASDMTKLYDMGVELDRRPFLDKLLDFLMEKGSPITTMPNISKQPLDLYKLYHCVSEKGGFVEVNKAKRWKEICTIVNIGCSASAAFTLKKNYLKYLFAFECKFDLGGVDPAPILAELETHGDRKREKKRVSSPGMNMVNKKKERKRMPSTGSQSSQDTFQSAPGPNSQMLDGYHGGGGGMPPPFMQGAEGQMMGPGGMMMPNMMGHPNMMGGPPHHQGSGPGPAMMGHGPNAMMGPSGQGMMGGGMGPQGGMMNSATGMMGPSGMMGPGGMHMGSNSYGPGPSSHSMMGGGSNSSMGPSPGPPLGNSNSSVSNSPGPLSNTTASSGVGTAGPPTSNSSVALPPTTTPNNSRPPTADSVSVQDPFADEPGKSSSSATFQSRVGGPPAPSPTPTPGGFSSPGPPTTSSGGYGSRPSSNSNPNAVAFSNGLGSEAGPNAFRRSSEGFPLNSAGPFPGRADGTQYPFGQENSSHPGQPFRPPSANSDTSYAPRFPGQQAAFRANGPGEAFGSSHPYPNHASGMGPRLPGQEGYSAFPSPQHPGVRTALSRDGAFPTQGRDGDRWSPMHSRSFPPNAPGTPPMGPYGRPPMRGSPQTRDKVLAAKLQVDQQKSCAMLPNTPFQPKKEIVFPADSVEATQPTLTKRRRLTHKDICPVEAWRLMMALKSGLLAESTWAIDTLNIMLFDDATVTYFNLASLPGLLEVLTEHFRASLLHIFHDLRCQELQGKKGRKEPESQLSCCGEGKGDAASLIQEDSEDRLDKSLYCADYTWVSRQGRGVVRDHGCADSAVLDPKTWDRHCNFVSGRRHWLKGGGDITGHVVPCFESGGSQRFLTDAFYLNRTSRKEGARKRKAAQGADDSAECQNGPKRPCGEECPAHKDRCEESAISLPGTGVDLCDHSKVCSQQAVHQHGVASSTKVKQEAMDSGLHHCQSQDSLPPPLLSHSSEGSRVSNEDGVKNSAGCVKENGDKCSPPQLTSEEEEKTERTASQDEAADQGKETAEKQESDAGSQGATTPKEEEDEMTAEIVAMMIKEQDKEMEEEAYRPDDPPLTTVQSDQEEVGHRCVAISNIFRSLSCIPGNEKLLAKHHGLMWLLGQLLLLYHTHPVRSKPPPAPPLDQQEKIKVEEEVVAGKGLGAKEEEGEKDWATCREWWWESLEALRENALVIVANICSHMHMRDMASEVCMPLLDGLLHWMVCPSSSARDPLPSAPSSSQLSPQRLVLEALCKLCIHEENVDLVLATPPFSRILLLLERLIRLLAERSQPVPREFSIVLLSRLVQGDAVAARAIALQHPAIPLLIEFLESAEQSAMAAAGQQGGVVSGVQSNPEALGTSLDMLCRAASTLLHMARLPLNRKLFLHHQSRLLALVMSQWLDSGVTQIISDVLFECSQFDPLPT